MTFYNIGQAAQYLNVFEGIKIGITSGCYDLLHPLHVLYFNKCKRECDILLVQVDSDTLTFRNKNKIPHINELDRAYMVDSLKSVDCTLVINSIDDINTTFTALDRTRNRIINFKNSDTIYGKPTIRFQGVELVIIPDVNRFNSTTEIQNYLKEQK